jgi:hypothetical protein
VFELVIWSFAVALAPVALGLAWKLVSGMGNWVGLGVSRAFESVEQRGPRHPLDFNPPSCPTSMAARALYPGIGRSWAPNCRGPSRG